MPKTQIKCNIPVAIVANLLPIVKNVANALTREGHKKLALEFESRVCGLTNLDNVMSVANEYLYANLGSGGYV